MPARRRSGELETEVLASLWAAPEPLTAAQVRDAVAGDLAYTTVLTILARLLEKGVLRRAPHGRAFAYSPTTNEAGLVAGRMHASLKGRTDRDAVLAQFVGSLSDEDEQLLRSLLVEADERKRQT